MWGQLCAVFGILLAAGSWGVGILTWSWVLTRPRGTFNDQGGLILTFGVLPLTLGLWLVGGPIALALSGRALKLLQPGDDTKRLRQLASAGLLLSRLLLWGVLGGLLLAMALS